MNTDNKAVSFKSSTHILFPIIAASTRKKA